MLFLNILKYFSIRNEWKKHAPYDQSKKYDDPLDLRNFTLLVMMYLTFKNEMK